MGRGRDGSASIAENTNKVYSWQEVESHRKPGDRWLVIDGQVYNISSWVAKHPGGSRVISHYAGQDATDAFRAFHNDLDAVKKYLKPIHVGSVQSEERPTLELEKDFRELRETAEKMGLFKPSYVFFFATLAHVLVLEAAAYLVMRQFGTGWIPWTASVLLLGTVQVQTGWLQHDFGHLSVFKNGVDRALHYFTMAFIKGVSPHWWNHLHYQHHAKPNVMDKDPDVRIETLFVVGDQMPVKIARDRKRSMPYNWQNVYWFILGPPLLFPLYFHFTVIYHMVTRRRWQDISVICLYFARIFYLYFPLLGWGIVPYYFAFRFVESHWFTWVSQSNHIPMDIKEDQQESWLKLQMSATCNLERSFFNDWFTGHLNQQIEHHLFPTMPRHNLYKVAPLVRSLCAKHGIDYQVKSMSQAFADIVRTLHSSGQLWHSSYQEFHSPSA